MPQRPSSFSSEELQSVFCKPKSAHVTSSGRECMATHAIVLELEF